MSKYLSDLFTVHECSLSKDRDKGLKEVPWWKKLQRFWLISEKDIRSHRYLRSRGAIELEKRRQMRSRYWYIVHPFSDLRFYWELFICILFFFHTIIQPFAVTFFGPFAAKYRLFRGISTRSIHHVALAVLLFDFFWFIDVGASFITGYYIRLTKQVVMNPLMIFRDYLYHFFLLEFVASLPTDYVIIGYYGMEYYANLDKESFFWLQVLNFLKLVRIRNFMICFHRVIERFALPQSKYCILVGTYIYFLSVHLGACANFYVPTVYYGRSLYLENVEPYNSSWITRKDILNGSVSRQYSASIFRALINQVGVGSAVKGIFNNLDQAVAMVISLIGRCFWCFFLIVLMQVIATNYASRTKFFEVLDQLKEYMKHQRLPMNMQKRLIQFYRYRFQTQYFRESEILGLLSDSLRKEISLYTCHKLVENADVIQKLPKRAIINIVECLKCEIYLPNDTIVEAGTLGDCMYFISSGTTAVYTAAGKEICRFHDGDYFGEVALILDDEKRTATVKALELTEIYRLDTEDFFHIIKSYPEIYAKIEKIALERYEAITKLDRNVQNLPMSSRRKTMVPTSSHYRDDYGDRLSFSRRSSTTGD